MGYKVYKFQNKSSFCDEIPTIVITDDDPNWNQIYQNWIKGNNPTNDPNWKTGVFAVSKLKDKNESN